MEKQIMNKYGHKLRIIDNNPKSKKHTVEVTVEINNTEITVLEENITYAKFIGGNLYVSHIMVDGIDYKMCTRCGNYYKANIGNFRNEQKAKDKLSNWCKNCHRWFTVTHKEHLSNYRKENPQIGFNASCRRRQREEENGNGILKSQWKEMMDFFGWRDAYSNEKLIERSIDHIIALNDNGVNEIWNLVPMEKSNNSSKSDKNVIQWYKQQNFFSEDRLDKIAKWQQYAYDKWATEDDNLILITDLI